MTYEEALDRVLTVGLLVASAHKMRDQNILYELLNQFVEVFDEFNEIVDKEFADEDEDDDEDVEVISHSVSLDGKKYY